MVLKQKVDAVDSAERQVRHAISGLLAAQRDLASTADRLHQNGKPVPIEASRIVGLLRLSFDDVVELHRKVMRESLELDSHRREPSEADFPEPLNERQKLMLEHPYSNTLRVTLQQFAETEDETDHGEHPEA